MSDTRKYRKFTAQQKTENRARVAAWPQVDGRAVSGARHRRQPAAHVARAVLAAGPERLQGRQERTEADELRRQVARLERASGRKTMELEIAGEPFAGLGVRQRVARSRELVAHGPPGGRRSGLGDQPPGDLPPSRAPAARAASATRPGRSGRAGGRAL